MTQFTWKILEIHAVDDTILRCRYHVTADDGNNKVDSEGWAELPKIEPKPVFADISEEMVAYWAKQAVPEVETRLQEQLDHLKTHKPAKAPWLPADTFRITL